MRDIEGLVHGEKYPWDSQALTKISQALMLSINIKIYTMYTNKVSSI